MVQNLVIKASADKGPQWNPMGSCPPVGMKLLGFYQYRNMMVGYATDGYLTIACIFLMGSSTLSEKG